MARFALAVLVIASLIICSLAEVEEKYDDRYDHVDVKAILANDRQRKQYQDCFLKPNSCKTADAAFMKEHFPEALVTKCRKCTEKQKEAFKAVAIWFMTNEPETWDTVLRKAVADFTEKGNLRRAAEAASKQSS